MGVLQIQERRWFRRVAENDNIREGKILLGDYIFYPRSKGQPNWTASSHLSCNYQLLLRAFSRTNRNWKCVEGSVIGGGNSARIESGSVPRAKKSFRHTSVSRVHLLMMRKEITLSSKDTVGSRVGE